MAAETQIIVSAKDLATDTFRRIGLASEGLSRIFEGTRNLIPFAGAGLGVHSFKELIEHQVEYMDQAGKMAQITGLTTQSYTELSYAAQLADVSGESLNKSIGKLSKNMVAAADGSGDAFDAFNVLGISVKDNTGHLKSADQILAEVADRFGQYKDGAEKTALAMALFGKSGAEMIPMLNKGSEEIAHMRAEAQALGLTFGEDLAHQAEEVNDNFKRLHSRTEALKTIFVSGMLPALVDTSEYMLHSATAADKLRGSLSPIETTARGLAFSLMVVKNVLDQLANGAYHGGLGGSAVLVGNFKMAQEEYVELNNSALEDLKDVQNAWEEIWLGKGAGKEPGMHSLAYAEHMLDKKPAPITKPGDKGDGASTIKTLTQEAMKAEQALNEMLATYRELELTLQGDTFGVTQARQQADFVKQQDEALRELARIADERKVLASKNKLTPEASGLLDRQAKAVGERLSMLPFLDGQKNNIATIANDIEKLNRDATHMTTMAGLTGQGVYEAQIAGIKAKYEALRMDPKTSQQGAQWDMEQEAALARAGQDHAKALAQQRGELAQLTNNTKEYYAAQAEVLTIERDLASTAQERAIKQQQLDKVMAQKNGDALDAMGRSLRAYGAEASDVWQNFYRAGANAAGKVEDALTDALSMKDVDIESLMQSLGAEITRAAVVRPLLGQLTELLGSTGLFGDMGQTAEAAALTTAAMGLDTSSIALETSAFALDTSAFALDTSAMGLDAAALALDAAAMSLGAGGVASSGGDGGLLSGFLGSFFDLDGAFADGGYTGPGRILVGEKGPEILELGSSGYVYNNADTRAMLSGAGGANISSSTVTIHQSFDFRGADTGTETRLRAAVGVMKKQAVAEALAQVKALSDRGGKFSRAVGRRT